jgi:hypothetical protein
MQVFVSHNKADGPVAREVALFLVAEEVNVWFDEWEIAAGESVVGRVDEGISRCTHFVILWSQNSARSNWVRRELNSVLAHAIETGNPRVIPILLDSTPLPPLLRDLRYIRYSGGSEADRRDLVREILGRAPSGNFLRTVVKKYHELVRSPENLETLGLRACPKCGSEELEPDTDVEVDYYDAVTPPSATVFRMVRCRECDWSRREDDPEIA